MLRCTYYPKDYQMKKQLAFLAPLVPATILAEAPFEGYTDTYAENVNHVSCFPHGTDKIGAGDVDGGMEI